MTIPKYNEVGYLRYVGSLSLEFRSGIVYLEELNASFAFFHIQSIYLLCSPCIGSDCHLVRILLVPSSRSGLSPCIFESRERAAAGEMSTEVDAGGAY